MFLFVEALGGLFASVGGSERGWWVVLWIYNGKRERERCVGCYEVPFYFGYGGRNTWERAGEGVGYVDLMA